MGRIAGCRMRVVASAAGMILTIVLAGCGAKSAVIGKWADNTDVSTIEFLSDGTCVAVLPNLPNTCSWKATDDGRTVMQLTVPVAGMMTLVGHFDGANLTFIGGPDNKSTFTLHRVS